MLDSNKKSEFIPPELAREDLEHTPPFINFFLTPPPLKEKQKKQIKKLEKIKEDVEEYGPRRTTESYNRWCDARNAALDTDLPKELTAYHEKTYEDRLQIATILSTLWKLCVENDVIDEETLAKHNKAVKLLSRRREDFIETTGFDPEKLVDGTMSFVEYMCTQPSDPFTQQYVEAKKCYTPNPCDDCSKKKCPCYHGAQ